MSDGAQLNIQLDAAGLTGGVDEALATLQKIRKLIADTEPITAKIAKGDLRGLDKMTETLRELVNEAHTTGSKIKQALASGAQGAAQDIQAKLVPALEKVLAGINNVALAGGKLDGPLRGRLAMLQTEFEGLRATVGTLGTAHQAAAASAVAAAEATVAATTKVTQATAACAEAVAAESTARAKRIELALTESEAFSAVVAERKLEAQASSQLVQSLIAEGKIKEAALALDAAQLDMAAYQSAAKKALVEANRAETLAVKASVSETENQTVITELQRQAEVRLTATRTDAMRALEMETALKAEYKQATQAATESVTTQAAAVKAATAAEKQAAAMAAERIRVYLTVNEARTQAIQTLLAEGKATEAMGAARTAAAQALERHVQLEKELATVRKAERDIQQVILHSTEGLTARTEELNKVMAQRERLTNAVSASQAQLNRLQEMSKGAATTVAAPPNAANVAYAAVAPGVATSAHAASAAVDRLNQRITGAGGLNDAFKSHTAVSKDLHSAYRGLASGFGAMWLTWGNVLPLLAGAAVSNAVNSVVRQGMEVDKVLTDMGALADYSAGEMKVLTKAVIDFSGASTYGPKEVAEALKVMALAGFNAHQSMAALPTVLDFTKISGEPLEKATEQLIAISTAFGYTASQMSIVADVIGKTAATTMATTSDMAAAFRTASVVAQQFGVSLNDAATSLGMLAQIGIKGQAAGTALRQFYSGIISGGKQTQQALKKLGIELYDVATKQLKAPIDIMQQVVDKLANMTALQQDQYVKLLSNERGGKVMAAYAADMRRVADETGQSMQSMFAKIKDGLDNAAGYTAMKAAEMRQSTEEQFKAVGATLQKDFFEAFQKSKPAIDDFVQSLKSLVNNDEFKDSLVNLTTNLMRLATWAVDHAPAIAKVTVGYVAFRGSLAAVTAGVSSAQSLLGLFGREVVKVDGSLNLVKKTLKDTASSTTAVADATKDSMRGLDAMTGTTTKVSAAASGLSKALGILKGAFFALGPAAAAASLAFSIWEIMTRKSKDSSGNATEKANKEIQLLMEKSRELDKLIIQLAGGKSPEEAAANTSMQTQREAVLYDLMAEANQKRIAQTQAKQAYEAEVANLAHMTKLGADPVSLGGLEHLVDEKKKAWDNATTAANADMARVQETMANIDKWQNNVGVKLQAAGALGKLATENIPGRKSKGDPNEGIDFGKDKDQILNGFADSRGYLANIENEIALYEQAGPAVDKYTTAMKEKLKVDLALESRVDKDGKAYTAEQIRKLESEQAGWKEAIEREKVLLDLKDKNNARQEAAKHIKEWNDSIDVSNSQLEAQIANYGKSRIVIEQDTLARMKQGQVDKERVLVGGKLIDVTDEEIKKQEKHIQLMASLDSKQRIDNLEKEIATAQEQIKLDQEEMDLVSLTAEERAKVLELRKVELHYATLLKNLDKRYLGGGMGEVGSLDAIANYVKEKEKIDLGYATQTAAAISKVVKDDFVKTADSINNSLSDALARGFENGGDYAKNFRDSLKGMFNSMMLRPVISFIVKPLSNLITGAITGLMGSAANGNGLLGMLSNAGSAYNFFNGGYDKLAGWASSAYNTVAGWFGGGAGAAATPAVSYEAANIINSTAALNVPGAGANASWLSSSWNWLAGGGWAVAVPLIVGALNEYFDNAYERHMGAATSSDYTPGVKPGSTNFDLRTGSLPDREAVIAAINALIDKRNAGPLAGDTPIAHITEADVANINDRTLTQFLDANRDSGLLGFGSGSGVLNSSAGLVEALQQYSQLYGGSDYYRGPGYIDAQSAGWWNDWDKDPKYLDPKMVEFSRKMALQFKKPLAAVMRAVGEDVSNLQTEFGFAYEDGHKNKWLGHYTVRNGDEVLQDFGSVASDKYATHWKSQDDMFKAVFGAALDTFNNLNLPAWAKKNVDGAKAQMEKLTGDDIAGQAAALYQQTAASIVATLNAINMLIDVFPEFAGATQDSVYAIAEALGGMQNLQQAWGSYLENFYSEDERKAAMQRQLTSQFSQLGIGLPTDRAGFRALMDAAIAFSSMMPPTVDATSTATAGKAGSPIDIADATPMPKPGVVDDIATVVGALGTLDTAAMAAYFPMLQAAMDSTGMSAAELVAALLGLQGSVASLYPPMDAAADAAKRLSDAQSKVDKIWSELQKLLGDALDAAKKVADAAKRIYQMAGDAKRQLWGQMADSAAWSAKQANLFIDDALRAALQPGGALPDPDELQKAIAAATAGLNVNDFASVADYEVQKAILAAKLGALEDVAGVQLTEAEQQVKLLEDQIDYWKKQIDLLRGTDQTVHSIDEGVAKLVAAMEEERALRAAAENPDPVPSSGTPNINPGVPSWGPGGGAADGNRTSPPDPERLVHLLADSPYSVDPVTGTIYVNMLGIITKLNPDLITDNMRNKAHAMGIPGFATGTDFVPHDMLANIHRGEMIVPAAPSAIIRSLLDGSDGGDDDSAILEEVRDLLRRIAVATDRGNDMFENVTAGGNAMLVETTK